MTIEPGRAWGEETVMPTVIDHCRSDSELANSEHSVVLTGGDVWLSLGKPGPKMPSETCTRVPLDRMRCSISSARGEVIVFAASHVRIGRLMSRGDCVVLSNCGFIGSRMLLPRAHPNDGEMDIMTVLSTMTLRERVIATRRARTGTHLPHPSIRVSRADRFGAARRRREPLFVDGKRIRRWSEVTVEIEPDELSVLI